MTVDIVVDDRSTVIYDCTFAIFSLSRMCQTIDD